MNILVLYATSDGQTRKIAEYAADCLRRRDHDVVLADATTEARLLDPSPFDAAILASRVHAGRHHRAIVSFARRHNRLLAAIDTAFLSVSMTAASQTNQDRRKLTQYRAAFVAETKWQPDSFHNVAGARLYTRHNRLSRWILGLVDHRRYDTSKDHEFTDWLDLRTFVDSWANQIETDHLLTVPFRRQSGALPLKRP
jgi:menaquinone-dependent protoporphyrinogen oxidase